MDYKKNTEPMIINEKPYYTMSRFAEIVNKSKPTVRNLVRVGNKFRKLKVDEIMGKLYIPASELIEFPFSVAGRKNMEYYNFDREGNINNIIQNVKINKTEPSRSF